jgi:ATP-binding cassette subfamily B protein
MVPQDIFLFSDTIANNIALGKPEASIEEIENAAKLAAVYDDIMEFSRGFDTIVGERGVTLSGGQKQRIAIARALLTNPKILILDDSLSAVDTKTEKFILNNLIQYRKEKTNIIIAHRISAISHADKIIVINEGNIVETGNHNELVKIAGIYNELYEKQKIEERIE